MANSQIKDKKIKAEVVEVAKEVKKTAPKTEKAVSKTTTKESNVSLPVFGLDGVKKGTVAVPAEIFGAKVNTKLMAQAVRVYQVNQRQGTAATKTRGDVIGSTRKIYRQKGTGRARHGAIKAPIFVGGGVALGPHPRNFELKMSKTMRRISLFSALSEKLSKSQVFAVDAAGATGKTNEMFKMFKAMKLIENKKKTKILFAIDGQAKKAARNIEGIEIIPASLINTYVVLNSNFIVFAKDSIENLEKAVLKKE